jgi:hypothetical protein
MRSAIKHLLTGAILLPACSTAQAEWLEIASNATVNKTLYVDAASKKKSKKFVLIAAMYDQAQPELFNDKAFLSSVHEYQVDCSAGTQMSLRRNFYAGPKATGPQIGSSNDTTWVPLEPATVAQAIYKVTLAQALLKAACAKD